MRVFWGPYAVSPVHGMSVKALVAGQEKTG